MQTSAMNIAMGSSALMGSYNSTSFFTKCNVTTTSIITRSRTSH
jgi:hypothetical protein